MSREVRRCAGPLTAAAGGPYLGVLPGHLSRILPPAASVPLQRKLVKQQAGATSISNARQSTGSAHRMLSPGEVPTWPSAPVLPGDAIPLKVKQRSVTCDPVGPVLDSLHPSVRFNSAESVDGSVVLGLASPVGKTSFLDIKLCRILPGRMLACARCKLWWMTPEWRSTTRTLPPETQFLLTELRPGGQGPYALILPLIDGAFRATIRAPMDKAAADGDVVLRVESGDDRVAADAWQSLLHVSVGWDPYTLVERGVTAAARLSGGARPLRKKRVPASLDLFGWCTWDAFYSSVSARGIQEGLRSLHSQGIKPRFLIIDDGWQLTSLDPPEISYTPATTPAQIAERISWLPEHERELLRDTEQEFYVESMEVLAEAAKTLPVGTSASTSIPLLSSLGPEGAHAAAQQHSLREHHHDSNAKHATARSNHTPPSTSQAAVQQQVKPEVRNESLFIARLGQKVAGWMVGLGTAAFLLAYQWLVEPAAPDSTPVRMFAALANGPLRGAMLGFYAGASDFTRRLTSVRANAKFASSDSGAEEIWDQKSAALDQVVAFLKSSFGLQYIYCWHGLPGYWAGISPTSLEMSKYGSSIMHAKPTPGVLEIEPSMAWNPAVLAGVGVLADPRPIYNSMHEYLSQSGIDGVKVDCQAGVGLVGSALGGGPSLSSKFHTALEDSIARYFPDNHAINCMCHSTENLYRMRDTAVARASDDFYPRDPASSQPHIAACAYNSVFLAALVQPDWDMFHSKHPAARLHAIARAISGGGVYVSDKPGEHDAALLRQLVLPDGSVLRCAGPGRPTRDCLFDDVLRDGKSALKVWNVNKGRLDASATAKVLNGVVAVFNLQGSSWDRSRRKFFVHDPSPTAVEAKVRPNDVPEFESLAAAGSGSTFVARVHGQPPSAVQLLDWSTPVDLKLAAATAEVVTIVPLSQCGHLSFAPIGWLDMLNSGGGVTGLSLTPSTLSSVVGTTASVAVRGAGTFIMYSSHQPQGVSVCGVAMLYEWNSISGAVTVEVAPTLDLKAIIVVNW